MDVTSADSFRLWRLRDASRSRLERSIFMDNTSNDNDLGHGALGKADAHGHAALVLVESLILSLVDRSVMDADEARDVVTIAIDATEEIAGDLAVRPASLQRSISLLAEIRHSLPSVQ